jgi:hypothetical protein
MTFPSLAVQAATPLYLTGEDGLRLTVFNSAAGVSVALRGRFLPAKTAPDEQEPIIGPFNHELVPTTNRAASTRNETLGEGWLLDWSVVVIGGTPLIGQTYAMVEIVRGAKGALLALSILGSGYVTANKRIGGPDISAMDFLDGGGALRSITAAVPAPGAEISETVPAGARWELICLSFTFVTAVAVANRVVRILIDDGTLTYARISTGTNQAASLTVFYTAGQGLPFFAFATDSTDELPLPVNLKMGAGHRWRTVTAQIQAADQYSAIQYLVREWTEGA